MPDKEEKRLKDRAENVRLIYTIANLYALATILGIVFSICSSSSARTGWLLLMSGGAFIAIPISTVVLWCRNRPCRTIHTKIQRGYLIVSRVFLTSVWLLTCVPVGRISTFWVIQEMDTKRVTTKVPLNGGHELIIKTTISPGFQDPNIKKKLRIRWASGRTEILPTLFHTDISSILEANGYVFLISGQTLIYRQGTISSIRGGWMWWNLKNSKPCVYAFLRQYAKEHDDTGVTIENEDTIRYAPKHYFFSGSMYAGYHLPHRIESIDSETLQIHMVSSESITSMPKLLIFSMTNGPPVTWLFDEAATRMRNDNINTDK